jgi:hypothetical protein
MPDQADIDHQQKLLTIHRRNLAHYLSQQAALGGAAYAPPGVANGILETRENIKRLKGILRGWGAIVVDHPDDEPPPGPEPAARGGAQATTSIGGNQINAQGSQGYIGQAGGPVSQNFGQQQTTNAGTVIHIHGGDFRGTNLPIGNTVGGALNQSGGNTAMSTFDQRGWNISGGNVYNIAGDLNIGANPSKDELLAALRQLQGELAKAQDLPPDEGDDLKANLDQAIRSVDRSQPNKDRAVEKLSTMKNILEGLKENVGSALALGNLIGQALLAAQNIHF